MKKVGWLALLLLVIFLLIDVFLLVKLSSLKRKSNTNQETITLKIETISLVKGFNTKLDNKKIMALLRESGFLNKNNLVLNLETLKEYSPQKVVFSYQPLPFPLPPLIEAFYVNDQLIYGYNVTQDPNIYSVNFYFDQAYLNKTAKPEVDYTLRSSLVEAVLYLGAIHQKQKVLSSTDREEVVKKLPDFLKQYENTLEVF